MMIEKLKNSAKTYFSNGPKAAFVTVLLLMCISITIINVRKTIEVSIDGKKMKVVTYRGTLRKALEANNIVLGPKDRVSPSLDSALKEGEKVTIKRAINVAVTVDGKTLNFKTCEDTVEKLLKELKISFKNEDEILPSVEERLIDGMAISIVRVDTKILKETLPIEFTTVARKDEDLEKGKQKTIEEGQKGEKDVTTRVVYKDGKEVSRQVVSETVKKKPVNKIVAIGTLGVIKLSRGDSTSDVSYRRKLRVKATAYSFNDGSSYGGRTASGTRARRNPNGYSSIAVDPRIIPLGTKVYVEGYGYAIAEDTGSAIVGNTIDLFFTSNSEVYRWGVRYVDIYILK